MSKRTRRYVEAIKAERLAAEARRAVTRQRKPRLT